MKNLIFIILGVAFFIGKDMLFGYDPLEGYEKYPKDFSDIVTNDEFKKAFTDSKKNWTYYTRYLSEKEEERYDEYELSMTFIAENTHEEQCLYVIVDDKQNVIQKIDDLKQSEFDSLDRFYNYMWESAENC